MRDLIDWLVYPNWPVIRRAPTWVRWTIAGLNALAFLIWAAYIGFVFYLGYTGHDLW